MSRPLDELAQAILDGRLRLDVWPHVGSSGQPLGGQRIEIHVAPPLEEGDER
jgi:hypothetical protein